MSFISEAIDEVSEEVKVGRMLEIYENIHN
jgi:hypothetical protein